MHKTFISLLSTALLAPASLSQAAGNPDNTLRIYKWADYIGDTALADFEKATGIKVIYDAYDSYETVQGKLLSGRSSYDLALLNASLVPLLIKGNVFQPLDKSQLPDGKNLYPVVLNYKTYYLRSGGAQESDYIVDQCPRSKISLCMFQGLSAGQFTDEQLTLQKSTQNYCVASASPAV